MKKGRNQFMVRGLYTGYTGMLNEQKRLDMISNNIANATTTGYKKEGVTNQSFSDVLAVKIRDGSEAYLDRAIGKMNLGVKLGEAYTDFKQGSLKQTSGTYDLAIAGNGFFALSVKNKAGEESTKYTRDGSFTMDANGYIVDSYGNQLKSENGTLQVPVDAAQIVIQKDGTVLADGNRIDRVLLFDIANKDCLKRTADNLYEVLGEEQPTQIQGTIEQGFLEQSNLNVVSEMVQIITVTRAYEANQKVIQTIDGMLDAAVNSVAKV